MRRSWSRCIRPGCLRPRLTGFPLCFEDWDLLPEESRSGWRACIGQGERDRWQIRFHERYARKIGLDRIYLPRPESREPVKPRRRMRRMKRAS